MCLLQGTVDAEGQIVCRQRDDDPSILAGAKEGVSARTCFPGHPESVGCYAVKISVMVHAPLLARTMARSNSGRRGSEGASCRSGPHTAPLHRRVGLGHRQLRPP